MTDDAADDGGDDPLPPSFGSELPDHDGRSLDLLLDALANRRARYVLSYFESASVDVADLEDLVHYIVERENEAGLVTDADDHHQRVAISLHHNRLPKLDETTVIDYDPRSNTVRYRDSERAQMGFDLFESEAPDHRDGPRPE